MLMHVEAPRLGVSWTGASGLDDRARRTRLRPPEIVRLSANARLYVAAAVLRLAERGRVSVGAPIARYLPAELVARLPGGARITVDMLLRHTSGLYDFATDPDYVSAVLANPRRRWTRDEQVSWALSHGQPYGAPGEAFHVSDTGYALLAQILERRTGRRGTRAAVAAVLGAWAPRGRGVRAHQYFGDLDAHGWDPSFDPGGDLVAGMRELARFWDGVFSGAVFARPATLRTLTRLTPQSGSLSAGMGLFRDRIDGRVEYDHGGFFGTRVVHFVAADVTIATSTQQALEEGNPVRPAYVQVLGALRGLRATTGPSTLCR
jgi:D-alanyl-D-alanine carboxypeptidase